MVLRGATSQWKRSRRERRAMGPASGEPAQILGMAWRCWRTRSTSVAGQRARRRGSFSSTRAPRKSFSRQKRITPALMNSPRSTRGTTRTMAKSNELSAGTRRLLFEGKRCRLQAPRQEFHVSRPPAGRIGAGLGRQPVLRDLPDDLREQGPVQPRPQAAAGLLDVPGPGEEHVVADGGEAADGHAVQVLPVVMEVERGPMIDQVERLVPPQEIGIARRAVHVGDQGVEPDRGRGEIRSDGLAGGGVEGDRAGEVVEPQVHSHAGLEQVADLGVLLVAAERRIDLHEDELGHGEAQGAADLAGDELGHQRQRSLAGAAELEHVHPEVVRLYDGGQRAAFAERGDVAGGADGAEHGRAASYRRGRGGAANLQMTLYDSPSSRSRGTARRGKREP